MLTFTGSSDGDKEMEREVRRSLGGLGGSACFIVYGLVDMWDTRDLLYRIYKHANERGVQVAGCT